MKVKVRIIAAPYSEVPTKSLQAILRNHAHDKLHVKVSIDQLYAIMGELARRREISGDPFKSTEEAWSEFQAHYMPLTPSPEGRDCLGNGEHPGFECQCDECDHYLACFPEYDDIHSCRENASAYGICEVCGRILPGTAADYDLHGYDPPEYD